MIHEREEVVTVRGVAILSESPSCILLCRQGKRVFNVPRYEHCNGTFALRAGRQADLVLPRWFVERLGLEAHT